MYYGPGTVVQRGNDVTHIRHIQQRAAGGHHGCHIESMKSYQKTNSVNWRIYSLRTTPPDNSFQHRALSFLIASGWNMAGFFFIGQWHRLTISDMMSYFQHGSHDVIMRRKVLPSGECTCSIILAPTVSAGCLLAMLVYSFWSIVHLYLFI